MQPTDAARIAAAAQDDVALEVAVVRLESALKLHAERGTIKHRAEYADHLTTLRTVVTDWRRLREPA